MGKEKECRCRCHTFEETCGVDIGGCCSQHHLKRDEWMTRINQKDKDDLMILFRSQTDRINTEKKINNWVSDMEIPEHIKEAILNEFWIEGKICENFSGVCEGFDVEGNVSWTLEVLDKFL